MRVAVLVPADDPVASRTSPQWALGRLREALAGRGVDVVVGSQEAAHEADRTVIVASQGRAVLGAGLPAITFDVPESLSLMPVRVGSTSILLATASDERGLVHAVLEVTDRIAHAADPLEALDLHGALIEQPVNRVRGVSRLFTSEVHDKPWLHDKGFWDRYLTMLAEQRFNRFSLTLGLGYNFPWLVTDAYLYFPYPFLVDVPGYRVRVSQLPAWERDLNLEMLRYASEETVRRGMDFQLGLWTHAYEWFDSPQARHLVEGLTPETHGPYCRDAIQLILEACPAVGGVTLRVHGESGIKERSWSFWQSVFDGIVQVGRPVNIDLHAKGLDNQTLEAALATGRSVTVSPKYWAEHMGLPYHQAGIRDMERAQVDLETATGKQQFMRVSEGTRPFTRYGYGDFLREDRDYRIVFRIWPGTQRLLLWGDPGIAAGYGRLAGIGGSDGLEWMEPLTFKGREGSGDTGSRDGYATADLTTADDWEKHVYTYRLWGRLSYQPDADPDQWRRYLASRLGPAAPAAESALASASKILPLVTTAFHPSASNNYYWPEMYTNVRMVWKEGAPPLYLHFDTPEPGRFGTVSPLDPEIFVGVGQAVEEAISGVASGRHTPLQVARWLEELTEQCEEGLAAFERMSPEPHTAEGRRLAIDVAILGGLGRFFANEMRAAVDFELYLRLGNRFLLDAALDRYMAARGAWATAAATAEGVYRDDLSFGPQPWLRGHWSDRIQAIEEDLEAMRRLAEEPGARPMVTDQQARSLRNKMESTGPGSGMSHVLPATFRRGEAITVMVEARAPVTDVRLRFRHMDQTKTHQEIQMEPLGGRFVGNIPAGYTESPFPIQYHFVAEGDGTTWLHPGLGPELSAQPYYVVRQEQ